jgi:hypothetical protein
MKDFIRPSGRLRSLPFPARLTYSVFLLFTLLALAESAWLGADMLGVDLQGIGAYYAGAPAPVSTTANPAADSGEPAPNIDIPSDMLTPAAGEAMPLRKLLEVTHFHLFSMPVYLMILAHLFMLSRLGSRHKSAWIVLGTLGVALHIVAPWIARSGTHGATLFYALSGVLLLLSSLVMSLVPLYEMWAPARSRS